MAAHGTDEQLDRSAGRIRFAVALGVVAGLGVGTMLYRGPGAQWIANQVGGVFYVLAGTFLLLTAMPGLSAGRAAGIAFAATCGIECLQLWQPAWLQDWRASFFGKVVLGNRFSWADFPYYAIGAGSGWLVARALQRRAPSR